MNEKALAPIHKSKGSIVVVKFDGGVEISTTTNALKICPDDSALIRTDFPTRRWADAQGFGISGVLMMLIQETGSGVKKKAVRLATNRTACCAHGSARFALQGSRRVCLRWELALLDISPTNRRRIND